MFCVFSSILPYFGVVILSVMFLSWFLASLFVLSIKQLQKKKKNMKIVEELSCISILFRYFLYFTKRTHTHTFSSMLYTHNICVYLYSLLCTQNINLFNDSFKSWWKLNYNFLFILWIYAATCMHSVHSGIDINIESLNFNYNEKW